MLAFFTLLFCLLVKSRFEIFYPRHSPIDLLILFTVALRVLFTKWRRNLLELGCFPYPTEFGVMNGLFIFCRFVLIIFMSTLLTLTTPPLELSDAIEYLLRPLKAVRFPVHEISLMLSIALRFVPTLMDETERS